MDAEFPLDVMETVLREEDIGLLGIRANHLKYSSVNISTLDRFGTLEFRTLRTPVNDPEVIIQWFNILNALRQNSQQHFNNPLELVESISDLGPRDLCQRLLPEVELTLEEEGKVLRSARLVQSLAYQVDWERA